MQQRATIVLYYIYKEIVRFTLALLSDWILAVGTQQLSVRPLLVTENTSNIHYYHTQRIISESWPKRGATRQSSGK